MDVGGLLDVIIPCYIANATPLIVARLIGKTHPLDGGRLFVDGQRILGDGKSIEGFISGILAGVLAGVIWGLTLLHSFMLAFGTMLGDALGSFIKRRLRLERGSPAPLLDQLSFILVAMLLYKLAGGGLTPEVTATVIVVTVPMHLVTNYIAYRLGLKNRPW